MNADDALSTLAEEFDDVLARLTRNPALQPSRLEAPAPLLSLLVECQARLAEIDARPPVPIRTVHHFACSGGTLISKSLAALPNTVVCSEVDPLGTLHLQTPRRPFFPTDLIADLRFNPRTGGDAAPVRVFQAGLVALLSELDRTGLRLVLRDHAHSHFCHGETHAGRPSLREITAEVAPVLSVLTVRDPVDSFISLRRNRWVHFAPDTFDEYCRRYLAFLDAHADVPVFRYEDFVRDPADRLAGMAEALELPFSPYFESLLPLFALSGDSGRSSPTIAPRPRGEVPGDLAVEAAGSAAYRTFCERLGYEIVSVP